MCIVCGLPDDLFCGLLLSWLRLVDIGRLDSAICKSKDRPKFLSLLSGPSFVLSIMPHGNGRHRRYKLLNDHFTAWLFKRLVAASDLSINAWFAVNHSERLAYLRRHGRHVRVIYLNLRSEAFLTVTATAELAMHCPSIVQIDGFRDGSQHHLRNIAASCPQLLEVSSFCGLSDETLVPLGDTCVHLRVVNSFHTDFTDVGLLAIGRHGCLLKLTIPRRCSEVTDEGLRAAVSCCLLLEELVLSETTQFTFGTFVTLGQHCRHLRELTLHEIVVTSSGSSAITVDWPQLEILRAEGAKGIAPIILAAARGSPRLRVLDVERVELCSEAVPSLAERCSLLEFVCFTDCESVSDEGITALVCGCPALNHLYLRGTSVTVEGLSAIRVYCCSLKYLEVNESMYPAAEYDESFFPEGVMAVAY
jgi:hypothetical protein